MTQVVTTVRPASHFPRGRAGCGLDHRDERKAYETSSYRCVRWWKMSVTTEYLRAGTRVANPGDVYGRNPKDVYGSQGADARALYRRINAPPAQTIGTDERVREPLNWGLLVALLFCLAFWGTVVFGLVQAL